MFCALQLPFVRGIELHCDHIQGVPGCNADATKQTQEGDHPWLTVAKHEEETTDTGNDAGSRCDRDDSEICSELMKQLLWSGLRVRHLWPVPHLTSSNVLFCPWGEQRRCCQAAPPTCRGSWQSKSCRHCWSRRWSPVYSPLCCGETCCWPVYSWQTCTWINLVEKKTEK